MNLKRHLILFVLKFIVVYVILILPVFRNMYADILCSEGNRWFLFFKDKGVAEFKRAESPEIPDMVAVVNLFNKQRVESVGKTGQLTTNDFGRVMLNWYAYLIVAYSFALIAATPIGWKRKLVSFAAALAMIYLYFIIMFHVLLLYKFDQNSHLQVVHLQGLTKTIVTFLYPILVGNPGTTVFMALLIWVLVIFRKDDLRMIKSAFFTLPIPSKPAV